MLHYTDNVTVFDGFSVDFGQKSGKDAPVFKNVDKIRALMISMVLEAYLMAVVVMVADGTFNQGTGIVALERYRELTEI